MNLYAYVGNDPINLSDPNGLCPFCPALWWLGRERFSAGVWGGTTSLIAEVITNRKATTSDLAGSFITGFASGALDFGRNKTAIEFGLAFSSSIFLDALNGRDASLTKALGAGIGAALIAEYGKQFGLAGLEQAAGKLTGKLIKELVKELTGYTLDLTAEMIEEIRRSAQQMITTVGGGLEELQRQFIDLFRRVQAVLSVSQGVNVNGGRVSGPRCSGRIDCNGARGRRESK